MLFDNYERYTVANILFVSLGSGFDPNFERNMGFVKEYCRQNDNVQILSVDIVPVKMLPEEKENEAAKLTRVQYQLQIGNSASFAAFINQQIPELSSFDQVIICDSIHFLERNHGNELMAAIKSKQPEMDVIVFDYTSFKMSNPFFKGQDLLFANKSFDFNKFIQEYQNKIIDLFKDAVQGRAIFLQIERQCMSNRIIESKRFGTFINSFSNAFTNKHLFKDSISVFDEHGKQSSVVPYEQFKNYLSEFISKNISIDLIVPKQIPEERVEAGKRPKC